MKLTSSDVKKICSSYNLGESQSLKPITTGYVNHSFLIKTDKGKFIAQVLGSGAFDTWKNKRMKLQFSLLDFMQKNNFLCEVPNPLKSKNGAYLSKLGKRRYWVYCYIEGEVKGRLKLKEYKQIAHAVAIFHKYTRDFGNKNDRSALNVDWWLEQYARLKQMKPRNKIDRLFAENADFFMTILRKINKRDWGKLNIVHSDITESNVIFKDGKIIGYIDFDNVEMGPKAKDIAISVLRTTYLEEKFTKQKLDIFLKEYEKVIPLSKRDKELIVPSALREYAIVFWWFYERMSKHRHRVYKHMQDTIKATKRIVREYKFLEN